MTEERQLTKCPVTTKRLIVCCDGTWMNSDNGYEKPSIFNSKGNLQVPSNVTRISRCFKKICHDGTLQVINYESGVGSGSTLDSITGGLLGSGLTERVREAYAYLSSNYVDGDEIFLVGFSRGAFTARSVAGMVANLGLLTREGLDHFYPIFKDMQHWMDEDYIDPFPNLPFSNKPRGPDAAHEYQKRLEELGYTRIKQHRGKGELIKIKAVCVWDTVGSLGVPRIAWLNKLGLSGSNDECKWHDTSLSDRIEHAFQALALDETRPPFSPAVWERLPENKLTTDLRQVWFPGNHANCGGGWEDQGVSNITLAWMMDQMASVGVEFVRSSLDRVLRQSTEFYQKQDRRVLSDLKRRAKLEAKRIKNGKKPKKREEDDIIRQWAIDPIHQNNAPLRPWGLGAIRSTESIIYRLSGSAARTPGLYKQMDPKTKMGRNMYLQDTNERIHSSVRIRLACDGLGLNDKTIWDCPALDGWQLKRVNEKYHDPVPQHLGWEPSDDEECDQRDEHIEHIEHPNDCSRGRWIWEYVGDDKNILAEPKKRLMVEEPLGPYERYLLRMSGGKPNVYQFADTRDVMWRGNRVPSTYSETIIALLTGS